MDVFAYKWRRGRKAFQIPPQRQRQRSSTPGCRMVCECQARSHKLLCNCLSCGFIVCQGNGGGECTKCPWCGNGLNGDTVTHSSEYDTAVHRVAELLKRRVSEETRVFDEELDASTEEDGPLLASFLGKDIEEERERLNRLESRLHEEHQARLQVSMSEFVSKHN